MHNSYTSTLRLFLVLALVTIQSLILQTNVDLGDKKGQILKDLSALVAASLGKPESYVGK